MNDYRININYAKALFMLATERGMVDRAADDMRLVNAVTMENRELHVVFANPTLPHPKKAAIVRDLFDGRVCDEVMAFLLFVVRKNRSVNLRGISAAYLDQWRAARGIVKSDFVTHQEVDDETRQAVEKIIADYTGRKVELHDRTDERMMGGFMMEFDHNMYDARLRTKIQKLRKEFAKNDYESKL